MLTLACFLLQSLHIHLRSTPPRQNGEVTFSLTVSVITFNRLKSLQRLLLSLTNAHYNDDLVTLKINVEAGAPRELLDFVNNFYWPQGIKIVNVRAVPSGLVSAVVESWYPASDADFGLLLEDDIEVSPHYYEWLKLALRHISSSKMRDRIYGVSLYTPRVVEVTNPYMHFRPDIELAEYNSFSYLHSIPCSWGALQFPGPWREFHQYMQFRLRTNDSFLIIPGSRSNGWKGSWKKYYMELAWAKGLYMLYPNFRNQSSFSTNHLEHGVHISKNDATHLPANYTVPLYSGKLPKTLSDNERVPILDVFNKEYQADPQQLLQVQGSQCTESGRGFVGTRNGRTFARIGNKLISGYHLTQDTKLVSTPQAGGLFAGFFFVGSVTALGGFEVNMFDAHSHFVRNTFSLAAGQSTPWSTSLYFANQSLRLGPSNCGNFEDCSPNWQVALNISSPQYILHLQSNGNLIVYTGCGCSNVPAWESGTAVSQFTALPVRCQKIDRQQILAPGMPLLSTRLNTLISLPGKDGIYLEGVMQPDGNMVIYRNPTSKGIEPVFKVAGKCFDPRAYYSFNIAAVGSLVLNKHLRGRMEVCWHSNFSGLPLVPHFAILSQRGSVDVYEGYSTCDAGRMVWSSHPVGTVAPPCLPPMQEQSAQLCGQCSKSVFEFFSDTTTFTVILSTIGASERAEILHHGVEYLAKHDAISCILVVWHKPFEPRPRDAIVNGKLVKFLPTSTDSLNNRFYPSCHISTQAVLILDDDIIIHYHDLQLLFNAWQLFKDKIVGFFPRWHASTPAGETYLFASENPSTEGYSIMLTKAMMLDKKFLYMYNCGIHSKLRQFVDIQVNCEDILMNFVVANDFTPSSLFVKPIHMIGDYGKSLHGSLQKRQGHLNVRTECLHHFETVFKRRLPRQGLAAYGDVKELGVQVRLNVSYAGIDKHHVDCYPGQRTDGCFLDI